MEDDKVIYPSKFRQITSKIKQLVGLPSPPATVTMDVTTVMRGFAQSDIWMAMRRMYPDHNLMSWEISLSQEGLISSIKFTSYRDDNIK